MNVHIIGFSGKIGSGKDYVAKNIFLPLLKEKKNHLRPLFLSFADPLKQECALRYNCSYEQLYKHKDLFTRTKLQEIGNEFREKYGKMVYVNTMAMNIRLHIERSDINIIIITDVRFPSEMEFIQKNGGKIYRIVAKKRTHNKLIMECKGNKNEMKLRSNHVSETSLDNENFDGYIENDPEDEPEKNVQNLFPILRNF